MEYREALGTQIPALGFGTWNLHGGQCVSLVKHALAVGYRHIDAAAMYGNQIEVGKALKASDIDRADLFITTKIQAEQLHYEDVMRSAERSLIDLNMEYVDLLLIHWPNPATPLAETLDAMNELKQAGRTRQIGVSNFPVKFMKQAVEECGAELFCNQVEYHPYLSQRSVLGYATKHGLLVTAYSPLSSGKHDFTKSVTLTQISEKYGKSIPQIVLRWLLQQDSVATIPKSSKKSHCQSNFDIFGFKLTVHEMREISTLYRHDGRAVNPENAPPWDLD